MTFLTTWTEFSYSALDQGGLFKGDLVKTIQIQMKDRLGFVEEFSKLLVTFSLKDFSTCRSLVKTLEFYWNVAFLSLNQSVSFSKTVLFSGWI